jgi:hypothetical protein
VRQHADRACARFATTRYYPLGVEKSGNGDRQVAAVAAPARGKTGPVPEITFLPSTLSSHVRLGKDWDKMSSFTYDGPRNVLCTPALMSTNVRI